MTDAPRGNGQGDDGPYRAMLQHLSDVIMVLSAADGTLRYVSPSVERVFGHRPDALIGTDPFQLVHPAERDREWRRFRRVGRAEGVPPADVFRFADAAGTWRTVETVANSLGDEGDVIVAVRDITGRVEVERELAVSEGRFATLTNLAPVAIFMMDAAGAITYANECLTALTGLSSAESLSEGWPDLVHALDQDRVQAAWTEVLADPRRHEVQLTLIAADGTDRTLLCRVDPMHDADGRLDGWIGTAEDVTALADAVLAAEHQAALLEQANHELRVSQASAAQANRAKSDFLSRMSHELRTPLNSIIGFTQLLELGDLSPAEQQEATSIILASGRHLLTMVEEVLDISRIETGGISLSVEPVDVSNLVFDALNVMRPDSAEHEVSLLAEGDGAVYARADRHRLLQVLLNLLSNAVKYNRPGGWVRVRHETDAASVRLVVSDSGRGIAPELQARLFQPFDRLGAEAIGVGGTGLGLTLSKALLEEMGGTLELRSEVDRGATFTLVLPRAVSDERALVEASLGVGPDQSGGGPPAPGPATTVLYIEDNPVNYKLVERTLQVRPDVRLIGATCGLDGLAVATAEHPDLILLDLHLPDVSGFEVLEQLRADPATAAIPVTVLTADAMPGRLEQVTGDGRTGYLTKPLSLPDLLSVIDTVEPGGGHHEPARTPEPARAAVAGAGPTDGAGP